MESWVLDIFQTNVVKPSEGMGMEWVKYTPDIDTQEGIGLNCSRGPFY